MLSKSTLTILKKVASVGYHLLFSKVYWNESTNKFEIATNIFRLQVWNLLIYSNLAGRIVGLGIIFRNVLTQELELTEKVLGWMLVGILCTLLFAELLYIHLINDTFIFTGETIKLDKKIRHLSESFKNFESPNESTNIIRILILVTLCGLFGTPSVVRRIIFEMPCIIYPFDFLKNFPTVVIWGISWICGFAIFFDLYHCCLMISSVLTIFISLLEGVKELEMMEYTTDQPAGLTPFNKIGRIYREFQVLCSNGTKLLNNYLPSLIFGGVLLTISIAHTTIKHGNQMPLGLTIFFSLYLISVGGISNRAGAVGTQLIKCSKEIRKPIYVESGPKIYKYETAFRLSCRNLSVPIGSFLQVNVEAVKFIIIDIVFEATICMLNAY